MSSTAEFAGYDRSWKPSDFDGVLETARRLFPNAAHYDRGTYRACLRPMTPDGPPLIGRSSVGNLWLNTGHGHMGWTMGPGAGKLIADVISGRPPEIDMAGMGVR
jgi:D-amino-acid dehydrogenase